MLDSTGASLGTFLDIQDRVIAGGERGLLGLAFHPNYASNGFFYVNYTRDPDDMMSGESGEGDTRVSRFSRIGGVGSNVADPASEFPIIDIPQPFSNHNAGDLNFGPDGNLWIAMGDGGGGCDPGDVSQDPAELLGKALRLDVDGGSPYAIPADNPFIGPDGIPGRDLVVRPPQSVPLFLRPVDRGPVDSRCRPKFLGRSELCAGG